MKIKLLLNEQEKITFDLCIKDSAKLILTYDPGLKSLSLDRTASGKVDFDESFPAIMKAPVQKKMANCTYIFFWILQALKFLSMEENMCSHPDFSLRRSTNYYVFAQNHHPGC